MADKKLKYVENPFVDEQAGPVKIDGVVVEEKEDGGGKLTAIGLRFEDSPEEQASREEVKSISVGYSEKYAQAWEHINWEKGDPKLN